MSYELTDADRIWNRAAMDDGGAVPLSGDVALASMLRAHGLVMNGGVLHAVELLSAEELTDAQEGFRFFGLVQVAGLLSQAKVLWDVGEGLDEHESRLDNDYARYVPDDSSLVQRFESHFRSCPSDFSPAP